MHQKLAQGPCLFVSVIINQNSHMQVIIFKKDVLKEDYQKAFKK